MTALFRVFRRDLRPGWRVLAGAALLGALVAAGQAPVGLWWLALAGLAGLTALVARQGRCAHAVWAGWIGGAGYFAASMFWIVEPFMVDAARDGWMAPFALPMMAFGMALFWALAGAASWLGRGVAGRALGFALGMATSDLARSYVLTGFPWVLTGHIWIGTPVMQAAAFVGPVGLTLIAALAAAAPALGRMRVAGPATVVAALGLLALWAFGQARLAVPDAPRDPAIHVRLVQPNATQKDKWRPEKWDEFMQRQFRLTSEPAAVPLNLVVWPETAVPWLLNDSAPLFTDIVTLSGGVPAAIGIQRAEGQRYFNSLAVTDGQGRVTQVYDKWHLAPFGEYIPLGDLAARFGITAFAARAGNGYTAGPGPQVLDLGRAGHVLPLICYEAVFAQDLRTPRRPDWILQITNDGWFGNLSGPYQHLAQVRLRAVEQGLPVLRAANTGVTAVIDAKGRVLQSVPLNTAGRIDAAVPPALGATVYARTGDLPETILLSALLLSMLAFRLRKTPIDPRQTQV